MKRVSRRTKICIIIIITLIKGSVAEDLFPYVKTSDTQFIKYRFSNVTNITLCVITETTLIEVINAEVEGKIEYLERIHNIKFERELIAIETIPELYGKPEKYNHIIYVPIPWELSLFEKETFWAATALIGVTETVIISSAPRKYITVNLDILQMDSTVQHVILTSLWIVAFISTASSVIYGNNRLSANCHCLQALTHRFVIHLWDTTSVFFAEPYPRIRNRVPDRIICLFWLLGSVVIVIFMTSYMQSDLMNESYSYIDSVYGLIDEKSIQPRLLSTGISINYLRRKALKDHKISNWLRKFDDFNFADVYDFNNIDYFKEICEGTKAIILDKQSCWWSIGRLLWEDHQERNKMKKLCQGVYLSKPSNQEYTAYLVNKSFHDNYPEFQESFDLSMMVLFECQTFKNLYSLIHASVDFVGWRKPQKEDFTLNLTSLAFFFNIYFIGCLFSIAVFLSEMFLAFIIFQWKGGNKVLRRRSRFFIKRTTEPENLNPHLIYFQ